MLPRGEKFKASWFNAGTHLGLIVGKPLTRARGARRPRNTPSGSGSSADPTWCGLRLEVLKGGKVSDPMPSDCLCVAC